MSRRVSDNINTIIENIPSSWLEMTTHRLDIYNESRAKTEFLEKFREAVAENKLSVDTFESLPTAFDYIRLGHQLSCVLEAALGDLSKLPDSQVISFASRTMPLLAIMRSDSLKSRKTHIYYNKSSEFISELFTDKILNSDVLSGAYGYHAEFFAVDSPDEINEHIEGSVVWVNTRDFSDEISLPGNLDLFVNVHEASNSSVIYVNNSVKNIDSGLSEIVAGIQHVRRRESIAMTPTDCYNLLSEMVGEVASTISTENSYQNTITEHVQKNTESSLVPVMASSGLSVQYAIFMGFVHKVKTEHPSKKIKFVIPPNCYGGTNDQARRIAAIDPNIDILDIPVDGERDMVSSLDAALDQVAAEDAVGIVLAEIPTNPRVEVPDMDSLGNSLRKKRITDDGREAEPIVFTVDQTFCPNVPLLGTKSPLSGVQTISYVSCSKFPSGGECTGGYAIGNNEAEELLKYVSSHMVLTDNQATGEQMMLISRNIPSMNDRIEAAYKNTVQFVNHIKTVLPDAKLNFVSDRVAKLGFTPSVFSLELPSSGKTPPRKGNEKKKT